MISPSHMFPLNFHLKIRRLWYRKKRFIIPIVLLLLLCIAGAIVGAVLGTRPKDKPLREFSIPFVT